MLGARVNGEGKARRDASGPTVGPRGNGRGACLLFFRCDIVTADVDFRTAWAVGVVSAPWARFGSELLPHARDARRLYPGPTCGEEHKIIFVCLWAQRVDTQSVAPLFLWG
jgi:hypothetical protein